MKLMKKTIILLLAAIMILCASQAVFAQNLAPDRSQQVLDLLAVECQKISDYAAMSAYGDTSGFSGVKEHLNITINNISILLNGYDNKTLDSLRSMASSFGADSQSASAAAQNCSNIRSDLYRKIGNDPKMTRPQNVSNFDECARAGYRVSGNTCFIGGTPVYDEKGNLIGYYYADCYDNQGFHPGSCWDCFYGADNNGCVKKR